MTPLWAPRVDRLLARRDVAGLVAALRYDDPDVRRRAAAALGALGAATALTPLLAAASDPDPQVQIQAARSLHDLVGAVDGWRALPVLVGALERPDSRALAVRLLGELGEPGATAPLLDLCTPPRPDPGVVIALTRIALASGRDALEVERLAMVVGMRDTDPCRLRAIAAVLAALDEPGFVGPLLDSMAARPPALASASDPEARRRWAELRERDDPEEARDIVFALLREHREAAIRGLIEHLRGPLPAGEGDEPQRTAYAWLDELADERDLGLLRALLAEHDPHDVVPAARLILWRRTAASLDGRPPQTVTDDDLATLVDMLARGEAAASAAAARRLAALSCGGAREAVSRALLNTPGPRVGGRLVMLLQIDLLGGIAAREPLAVLEERLANATAAAALLPVVATAADAVPALAAALGAFGVLAPPMLEEALARVGTAAALTELNDYRRRYGSGRARELAAELALLLMRREALASRAGAATAEGERERIAAAVRELDGLGEQAAAPLLGALRDWSAFQGALNRYARDESRGAVRLFGGLPDEIVALLKASSESRVRDELATIGAEHEQQRAQAAAAARRRSWDE